MHKHIHRHPCGHVLFRIGGFGFAAVLSCKGDAAMISDRLADTLLSAIIWVVAVWAAVMIAIIVEAQP